MNTNFTQTVEMTDEEKFEMYMKLSKEEIIKMHIQLEKMFAIRQHQPYYPQPQNWPYWQNKFIYYPSYTLT